MWRGDAGRALLAAVPWVLIGFVVLVIGGALWLVVASSNAAERNREDARISVARTMNQTNTALREAIADGDLSEADVALVRTTQDLRSVRREADRVVITTSVEGSGSGWFGSGSGTQCVEYEIALPITAETVVRQREVDSCPSRPGR
ncbi:hypothetical protein [Lentzea sp. NPDC004782]|uniref:hypothetical protein n=1 Tax=Lentzea sp. NPDC004782 TaxID=3154458 RepID=UPI00339FC076